MSYRLTGIMSKVTQCLKRRRKDEGGSLIVESTIVYPIVFFVLLFLLYMGNLFYLKANIDSVVARESVRYASKYADPNLEDFQEGIPTSIGSANNVTKGIYRYVNILDMGSINKASTQTKNELIKDIKETGFYGGMTPTDIKVVSHKCNNYVVYQTYEVEVSYDLKFPIKFIFNEKPTILHMSSREETPVTDTSEFIRNVDFAVDVIERTKVGESIGTKMDEVYAKIDTFVNGKKPTPDDDAVAGGAPGSVTPELTTAGLRDEFGYDNRCI